MQLHLRDGSFPSLLFVIGPINCAAIKRGFFWDLAMNDKKGDKEKAQEEFARAEELFQKGNYKDASAAFASLAGRNDLAGKLPKKAAEFAKRMKPDSIYYYVAAGTTVFLFLLYLSFH